MNPVNFGMSLHKLDDVFHPNIGEVRSDGAEGIACWFIGTVCNEDAWAFDKPESGRITVKVINHLGDAVKAFRAD